MRTREGGAEPRATPGRDVRFPGARPHAHPTLKRVVRACHPAGATEDARLRSFDDSQISGYVVEKEFIVKESGLGADLDGDGTMTDLDIYKVDLFKDDTPGVLEVKVNR